MSSSSSSPFFIPSDGNGDPACAGSTVSTSVSSPPHPAILNRPVERLLARKLSGESQTIPQASLKTVLSESQTLPETPLVESQAAPAENLFRQQFGEGAAPTPPRFDDHLRGSPVIALRGGAAPPSSLYTAVVSPKEMAQHEATNFKNVKGVYKNCRGIWAAQWTDERGQRHTKYFNPKYYVTEAVFLCIVKRWGTLYRAFCFQEARHEAFKFKVHIAREIELRGGVQKRRVALPRSSVLRTSPDTSLPLEHPYVRQRRPARRAIVKAKVRESHEALAFGPSDFGGSDFAYSEYLLQLQQQQLLLRHHHQQRAASFGRKPHDVHREAMDESNPGSFASPQDGRQAAGAAVLSANSPPLFYNPQPNFDSFQAFSLFGATNGGYQGPFGTSEGEAVVHRAEELGFSDDAANSLLHSPPVAELLGPLSSLIVAAERAAAPAATEFPPGGEAQAVPLGTALCACGCGGLAIAPAKLAATHIHVDFQGGSSSNGPVARGDLAGRGDVAKGGARLAFQSDENMAEALAENPFLSILASSPVKRLEQPHGNAAATTAQPGHGSSSDEGRFSQTPGAAEAVPEAGRALPFSAAWTRCFGAYADYPSRSSDSGPHNGPRGGPHSGTHDADFLKELQQQLTSQSSTAGDSMLDAGEAFCVSQASTFESLVVNEGSFGVGGRSDEQMAPPEEDAPPQDAMGEDSLGENDDHGGSEMRHLTAAFDHNRTSAN